VPLQYKADDISGFMAFLVVIMMNVMMKLMT